MAIFPATAGVFMDSNKYKGDQNGSLVTSDNWSTTLAKRVMRRSLTLSELFGAKKLRFFGL